MRRKNATKGPLTYKVVKVEWTDAWSEDGWTDIKRLPENRNTAKVSSIGYLVNEDDEFYYIANSVSLQQAACSIVIPKSMVTLFEEV